MILLTFIPFLVKPEALVHIAVHNNDKEKDGTVELQAITDEQLWIWWCCFLSSGSMDNIKPDGNFIARFGYFSRSRVILA